MKIAFYKGRTRLFNRFVSWWTSGPYSHAEAVFDGFRELSGPVLCGSSSFLDGGVRLKMIELQPDHWDVIEVPSLDGSRALDWFHAHLGAKYDVIGLLSTSCPIRQDGRRYFCNEAIGTAGGLRDAWRFNPNSFARICELLPGSKWVRGGPVA
ncbi:hypothetical protein [Herbaspirillum sp. ST 5-3]|uniref:hypothetical protein n=1 Tax=Oxalobacteraceae TaxID=75682 RepID=UPI0010A43D3C|nr:hypothetical protein [Herbaspirillum sp. ST 5-3]